MSIVNHLLTSIGDLLLQPFALRSPWPGLVFVSLVAASVLVGLFSFSSNPTAIRRGRDQLLARVLELLLFRHDLRVSLSACWRIAAANARYLWAFVVPMAVSILPLWYMFALSAAWFEYRPLRVGETGLVEIELDRAHSVTKSPLRITTSDSLQLVNSGVRIPSRNELCLSLRTRSAGPSWIELQLGDRVERRPIVIDERLVRVAPQRRRLAWWQEFFSPAEPSLASTSPLVRFDVRYPVRQLLIGDREIHWTIAAFVLIMVFSLFLGKIFGIRIA